MCIYIYVYVLHSFGIVHIFMHMYNNFTNHLANCVTNCHLSHTLTPTPGKRQKCPCANGGRDGYES